jgi:hypothetical protein
MLVGVPQAVGGLAILFICFYVILFYFSLFLQHAPGACGAVPRGRWPCYFILFILFWFMFTMRTRCSWGCPKGLLALLFYYILYYFNFILVYFCNTHQVLIGLPQSVGGFAVFF